MKILAVAAAVALATPALAQHHAEAVYKARVAAERSEAQARAEAATGGAVADETSNRLDAPKADKADPALQADKPGA